MLNKGSIVNEWGEVVGRYWYWSGMNRFSMNWLGCKSNGWTEEGLAAWANKLEYYLEED